MTIGEALPREMTRIRDEVMPAYLEIGTAGAFALEAAVRSEHDPRTREIANEDHSDCRACITLRELDKIRPPAARGAKEGT